MNNKYFNYPHKELYNSEYWTNCQSAIFPLTSWMDMNNRKDPYYIREKPESERNSHGKYLAKENAYVYPEVIEYWNEKKMNFHCADIYNGWVCMVPQEHIGASGYDVQMDTLVVLCNGDRTDPNWAMYMLDKYSSYVEDAAEKRYAVLLILAPKVDPNASYVSIMQEAIIIFHLNYNRFYLDVSTVYQEGLTLKEIPGFTYFDDNGNEVADPDACVVDMAGTKALNISNRWTKSGSATYGGVHGNGASNEAYIKENLINSNLGKTFAQEMYLEHKFKDATDPEFIKHWEDMGLKLFFNEENHERWIAVIPKSALETGEKLPCVCIFHEVNKFDPYQAVSGISVYSAYMELAAQGDCMLIFFALEAFHQNDLLHDILESAEHVQKYPIDRTRVYLTGHSHNGRFTAEYTRRHPLDIAAAAPLGNEPGQLMPEVTSGFFVVTDEMIELQATQDTPLVYISGHVERNSQYPLHSDAPYVRPGQWVALKDFENRAKSWQRRLKSMRCPMKTIEEIAATKNSPDYVERQLGFPCDKTEVLYLDGSENYIGDIKNIDGKYHFRVIALGNLPHMITPQMCTLAWSFMRRFARNRETGECIELY